VTLPYETAAFPEVWLVAGGSKRYFNAGLGSAAGCKVNFMGGLSSAWTAVANPLIAKTEIAIMIDVFARVTM